MLVSRRKRGERKMDKVRISVDYETYGYNKIITNNTVDIIKTVLDALDSNVKEINIKKEPTHNVSVENT